MHDIVVLGSGAGGLSAALTAARSQRSVLVLEAARDLGGMLNPFSRRRYEFDVGIHYLGQLGPGMPFRRLLDKMGLEALQFREINPDCIDRYVFDGYEARLVKGLDRFIDRLKADFPAEGRGLDRFRDSLQAVAGVNRLMTGRVQLADVGRLLRRGFDVPALVNGTFGAFTARLIKEPLLRAALAGPMGDIGLPPGKASAVVGMMVLLHYLDGAWYPVGGSGAVRDAFVAGIRAAGGELRAGALVQKIRRRADHWEVQTEAGSFPARKVISDIDAVDTFAMVEGAEPDADTRRKARAFRPSLGSVCVFVGTDLDPAAAGLGDSNLWHYGNPDIDALYAPLFEGSYPEEPSFFLTCPTLKDPSGHLAPAGRHSVEIVSFGPSAPFRPHFDEPVMRRAAAYQEMKQRITERLLEGAERYLPGLRARAEVVEAATPATVWTYVRGRDGGIYGPEHSPDQVGLRRFRTRTGLPDLFLAGASVLGGGVYPCLLSGVMAGKAAVA